MDEKQFELIEKLINKDLTKLQIEQLKNFEQLFKIYNSHTNLMSQNDEKVLFEKHIYDSLSSALFFSKYLSHRINDSHKEDGIKLLDVGTGGGFPAIPLSVIYPDMQIFAVDSIAKKIGFIELVQKELRLDNLHPICKRVENLKPEDRDSFDVVTSRAVAPLNTLLEYTIPFVKTGAFFVAFKARNASLELEQANTAMKVLSCNFVESISYELPLEEDFTRELLVFKKLAATDSMYPRKSGLAKKLPL